ncbi:MAG: prepilin-type N-terminal cleavage/methylation domain-containing protein [Chthoniobacteraceae bacterium]
MNRRRRGFSLIEVVIALGVVSYALLLIVALVPHGVKTNKASALETRATCILSLLEADLRNSHPLVNEGKSKYFGLQLPYSLNAAKRVIVNPALSENTLSDANSAGVDDNEMPVAASAASRPPFQVAVVYTRLPGATSSPVEARLVVRWPYAGTSNVSSLISATTDGGYVESFVAFPAP